MLDGEAVRVFPDGRFVLGIHRDGPERVTLTVVAPDGTEGRWTVDIAQRDYDIQRIDGLPPASVTPPPEILERIAREAEIVRQARSANTDLRGFEGPWIWPSTGRISGVFGSQRILNGEPRQPHYGIDIAVPTGTEVLAPTDGVVTLVEPDLYFSGGTLMIDHGAGVASTFLHLDSILVQPGQTVQRGEVVARAGSTGRSTGPHLDWRVNWFEARVDASLLVPPMPAQ
jgi:murein DD-endopeptidase MepM/ murein hydrolase activator NlpD